MGLTLFITALLLLMLLSFRMGNQPEKQEVPVSVVTLEATENPADAPGASKPKSEQADTPSTSPRPVIDTPLPPPPVEQPPVQSPPPPPLPAAVEWAPSPTNPPIGVRAPGGRAYGPPNTGGSASSGDSERVGTAPNGEALYAAAWYREPSNDELRGYLSTADGPGWGLIACRTAPDFRVEDCVGLDEYPNGSQITRAVLAAAWQFRVRPPRVGGKSLVGSWVRIRIDYRTKRG